MYGEPTAALVLLSHYSIIFAGWLCSLLPVHQQRPARQALHRGRQGGGQELAAEEQAEGKGAPPGRLHSMLLLLGHAPCSCRRYSSCCAPTMACSTTLESSCCVAGCRAFPFPCPSLCPAAARGDQDPPLAAPPVHRWLRVLLRGQAQRVPHAGAVLGSGEAQASRQAGRVTGRGTDIGTRPNAQQSSSAAASFLRSCFHKPAHTPAPAVTRCRR